MAMVEGEEVAASVSKREPASPSLCADCASSSADLSDNAVPAALGRFLAASALRAASSAIVLAGVSVDEGVDLVRVGVGVLDRHERFALVRQGVLGKIASTGHSGSQAPQYVIVGYLRHSGGGPDSRRFRKFS
jgi:hypothetical protein